MYTHTHGILLSHYREEWNIAIYSNIDGTRDYLLTEVNQTGKHKYIYIYTISLIYGILKNDINEFTKQTQTHSYRKQTYLPKGKGHEGGIN